MGGHSAETSPNGIAALASRKVPKPNETTSPAGAVRMSPRPQGTTTTTAATTMTTTTAKQRRTSIASPTATGSVFNQASVGFGAFPTGMPNAAMAAAMMNPASMGMNPMMMNPALLSFMMQQRALMTAQAQGQMFNPAAYAHLFGQMASVPSPTSTLATTPTMQPSQEHVSSVQQQVASLPPALASVQQLQQPVDATDLLLNIDDSVLDAVNDSIMNMDAGELDDFFNPNG